MRLNKTVEKLIRAYKRSILRDEFLLAHKSWKKVKGDQTLRLDYDLDEDSIVFDVGGYVGDFTAQIYDRFGCMVYLFEPSTNFYLQCLVRFEGNDKIKVFNFGLSDLAHKILLSDDDDGASIFRTQNERSEQVELQPISDIFDQLEIKNIDLMKVNIEGGEFPLLQALIQNDLVQLIRHLQVQFHEFIPNARTMREDIRRELRCTHEERWCFPFIWESWERRVSTQTAITPPNF